MRLAGQAAVIILSHNRPAGGAVNSTTWTTVQRISPVVAILLRFENNVAIAVGVRPSPEELF